MANLAPKIMNFNFSHLIVSVSVSGSGSGPVFVSVSVSVSVSLSLSLSSLGWQGRAESEKGLSSPVPDQQRSSSCFPVCFVGFPIAHLPFVCLNHGGGSLAPVSQIHAEQVVESELVSQLRPSYRRWVAKPCLDARFRATAAIREHSHIASTTESAS